MRNLDMSAAQTAQNIVAALAPSGAKKEAAALDNLATKALGVLQENGVYAATLFLYSRTSAADKQVAGPLRHQLLALAAGLVPGGATVMDGADASVALKFVTQRFAGDLDTLLLVKQVWEQTLIYVRYGAKAQG